jgi:hypothetical protein
MSIVVIFFCIGLVLSILSSLLVLIALLSIPFKDISTYLRIYSTSIDFLLSATFISGIIYQNHDEVCFSNIFFLFLSFFHGMWNFFLSFVMYKVICLKKGVPNKFIHNNFVVIFFMSVLISLGIMADSKEFDCMDVYSTFTIYYIGFSILLPEFFICIAMGFFYCKIQKTFTKELLSPSDCTKTNKELFTRLFLYPVIFLFYFACNVIVILEISSSLDLETIDIIRALILSFYMFFNSLLYGATKSFLRFIKHSCRKKLDYNKLEEYLEELRKERLIYPRYYYDLRDQDEDILFSDG